jgi:drug/metabolite transporter (DMT)-like permease
VTSGVALALAVTILLEVAGQTCFKLGLADHGDAGISLWRRIAGSPAIVIGVLVYVLQITGWLFVLQDTDLSAAYPFSCLSYCGVALASRFVLGERLTRRRWLGTAIIALGAAIVSLSA